MRYIALLLALALAGAAWADETGKSFAIDVLYNLGGPGFSAITGDYDGDGKLDAAVYEESSGNWYIALSASSYTINIINLGGVGYTPVWGDYDGDAKADPAVYQETTGSWYARLSYNSYEISWMPDFGEPGYAPMPGDYDGDGETEMALYHRDSGTWYLLRRDPDEITDMTVLAGMYSNAMVNASNVTPAKIKRNLTAITPDNTNLVWRTNPDTGAREVLMVSFMPYSVATNYYHVGQYSPMKYAESWLTLVPDLKNVCRAFTGADLPLRLKQVLGLPANSLNDTVVEFYVEPRYLWRPSRDPEISDRESEVAFRTNSIVEPVSTNYLTWFQNTIASRNYGMTNGVWNAYPWGQLGYTYDWLKTGYNIAGLSEFVLSGRTLKNQYGLEVNVFVVTVTGALAYATAPDNSAQPTLSYEFSPAPTHDR